MNILLNRPNLSPVLFSYDKFSIHPEVNLRNLLQYQAYIDDMRGKLNAFILDIENYYNNKIAIFYFRDFNWMHLPGLLLDSSRDIIIIVFKENDEIKAYINSDYLYLYPTRRTILNKYAKLYGVTKNSNIILKSLKEIHDKFRFDIRISMNDYSPEEMERISKLFIEQELKRLEVV